jgi:hypothetical protein
VFWPNKTVVSKKSRFRDELLFAQDSEHLGAASRANARHSAALDAALTFHGNFFGVLHLLFGLAFDTVCFSHNVLFLRLF